MNANATRDAAASPSAMTPVASKISEALLPIMQYIGIRRLDVRRQDVGCLSTVSGSSVMFEGTPDSLRECADAIKDALATIMASSGIVTLEMSADASEIESLMNSYEQLDIMYKAAKISFDEARAEADTANSAVEPKSQDGNTAEQPEPKRCKCGKGKCSVKKK